jgi:hypothetical protein
VRMTALNFSRRLYMNFLNLWIMTL